jgi:hypothetical protein
MGVSPIKAPFTKTFAPVGSELKDTFSLVPLNIVAHPVIKIIKKKQKTF